MLEFVTSQISWLHRKPCLYEFYVNIFSCSARPQNIPKRKVRLLTCNKQNVVRCRFLIVVGEHGGQASADLREVRGHRPVLKQNVHENISKAERLGTKLLS